MCHLIKCVYLFSIGCERHESCVQVNKTPNHKVFLTDSGLLGAAELPCPHHVAVAALDAKEQTKRSIVGPPQPFWNQNISFFFLFFFENLTFFVNIPIMDVAFIVTNSDSDISYFAEIKVKIILMIVRSDPAHPHTSWFLTCEDPHRVVILENEDG